VLSELTGEEEADGGLDLSGGQSVLLVVADELGRLKGDLLEDVIDERVHNVHRSLGDADLGVDLLQHTVDVDGEGLNSAAVSRLGSLGSSTCFLGGLLSSGGALSGAGGSFLGSHFEKLVSLLEVINYKFQKAYIVPKNPLSAFNEN
jgi:hypothetical protein